MPNVRSIHLNKVRLRPGLFQGRFEVNRAHMHSLKPENLLQNHYFEAGLKGWQTRPGDEIHWGWESPTSLVRGHFVGHWMSAAARIVQNTGDVLMKGKLEFLVSELARVQQENGGEYVSSMPERYFDRIARNKYTWGVQYILEKNLLGLLDTYKFCGNDTALEVLVGMGRWLHRWTRQFSDTDRDRVIDYECGSMLEVWSDVYAITGDKQHLDLIRFYDRRQLFDPLIAGKDMLTNRHANTTIPEGYGAARAWEATGEQRFREAAEAYWRCAVTDRGFFATGGQTLGEVYTPPFQLSTRLGDTNQEFCTVYNLMRLADYLFRWTGDPAYADYRERNLYNGVLAQQHPRTGLVSYSIPMRAGGRKGWSRPNENFFCCDGTIVQAHSIQADGVWYEDDEGLMLCQYVASEVDWEHDGTPVSIRMDHFDPDRATVPGRMHLERPIGSQYPDAMSLAVRIDCARPTRFSFKLRLPWWLAGEPSVTIDGERQPVPLAATTFQPFDRVWEHNLLEIRLPRTVVAEPLPDAPDTVAFLDGPAVLAGLCDEERTLRGSPEDAASLLVHHDERHHGSWRPNYRVTGQGRGLRMVPLLDIVDDPYTIYFPVSD